MKPVDLHMHTYFSDGRLSPKEVIRLAEKNNLKVIAITDHETISGLKNLKPNNQLRIIPGIEIPCSGDFNFPKVDVVGLFIDIHSKPLNNFLNENFKKNKYKLFLGRFLKKIIFFKPPKIFLKYYKKFLSADDPNQIYPPIDEVISVIKQAGGVAVLAHPGIIPSKKLIEVVENFANSGGKAIEVNYPYDKIYLFSEEQKIEKINEIKILAKKHNLLFSGGSDYHGGEREVELGEGGVNIDDFKKLENARQSI